MAPFDRPFGNVIFCEDIRQEVTGQVSYIGVFTGMILIPAFPVGIPKFAVAVQFYEPRDLALKRDFVVPLLMYLPGDTEAATIRAEIPANPEQAAATINAPKTLPDDPDIPQLLNTGVNFGLAPLVLQQPGRIKIRADYGGEIVKIGSIRVETLVAK